MKLRLYQEQAIKSIALKYAEGKKKVVFVLPTGGGKTVCFSYICKSYVKKNPNKKVLIITDRLELLSQAGSVLRLTGLDIGFIISGGTSLIGSVQVIVGMVETYYRRLKRGFSVKNLGLIIIDEAHKGNFKKIIKHHKDDDVLILGATATPLSSSRKDPLKNYYDDIVVGTDILDLISLGFLSKPTYYAVPIDITANTANDGDYKTSELFDDFNKSKIYDGVVDNYKKHAMNKKTLIFCVNIEHAKNTYEKLLDYGCEAKVLTSKNSKEERKAVLKWYKACPNGVLVNCGILTTGFDEPSIECVILNRATKSLPLFLQMIGRGSRLIKKVKSAFIVIDMGNNLNTHGLWHEERNWEEIFFNPPQSKRKKDEEKIEMIKECPECESIIPLQARECNHCGYEFPISEKEQEFALTEKVTVKNFAYLFKKNIKEMTVDELMIRRKMGNKETGKEYQRGWIVHQLLKKENPENALEEYAQKMGYKKGWTHYQLGKFNIAA